jgi:DNA-binding NtrC family response regulator
VLVTSAPGEGSTFRVFLPLTHPHEPRTRPITPSAFQSVGETVLLVDDEDSVRRIAGRVLEADGYTVLTAANPAEALAIADRAMQPIQVLLTDVVMPGMSGPRLASRLKAARPELRVVYMSGYPDTVTGSHGVFEPGSIYVQKPFSPGELREKIRAALSGHSANAAADRGIEELLRGI